MSRLSLVNDGEQAWALVDGDVASSESDRDRAWNSTFGSHYVFCMPFKLTDLGTRLRHDGPRALPGGASAAAVVATYAPGAGSAAGMHTWTYYFEVENGRLAANHLRFGPEAGDNSFGEYTDYRRIDGLYVPTRRLGYASSPEKERGRKTSEILYQNVRFDVPLSSDLFER